MLVAILVVWTIALNTAAFEGWWSSDDPLILQHAIEYEPHEYFFQPDVWQRLRVSDLANFTPLLVLSFDFDHALFGQSPQRFYLHHIAVSVALALAIFAVLSLWTRKTVAFAGAMLAVAGAPLRVTAQELMSRHYLEGLLFALLTLLFFTRYLRVGGRWRVLLAAGLYLGAVASKEIFLPLPILLALLPESSRDRRLRAAGLLALIGVVFVVWRWGMIGSLLGGPSATLDPRAAMMLPVRAASYVLGSGPLGLATALLVAIAIGWVAVFDKRWLGWLSLAAVLSLVPLVPIAGRLGPRHVVLPWVIGCCVFVLAAEAARARSKTAAHAFLLILLLLGLAVVYRGQVEQERFVRSREEYRVTGEFSLGSGGERVAMATDSLNTIWFFDSLHWLEAERTGEPIAGPRIVFDEIELELMPDGAIPEVWEYDPTCSCMVERTRELPARMDAWRDRLREVPLSVVLGYRDGEWSWRLGAERGSVQEGRFTIVAPEWIGARSLPPSGSYRLRLEEFEFRVRFDSPEGWVAYTPVLRFDPAEGELVWPG